MKKTKDIMVLMLCGTVCLTVLAVVFGTVFGGRQMAPESAEKMFGLVTYILGTVAGWLLSKDDKTP